ncbi:hypothetical protein Poli38472_001729 [Pythium oligandrum]|uniref:DUF155 domain-containing protein n=1 Tax=Pythium oligandrum TaxID=41045 RepID=A0A8K1CV88_PYTOL|nr:hypothetical protein Poli38472_001729 [Pythium oligandrum]|eukprot:TMW69573.1 hypothetical protein Poli38472_001729 [Pythium oligandrum]
MHVLRRVGAARSRVRALGSSVTPGSYSSSSSCLVNSWERQQQRGDAVRSISSIAEAIDLPPPPTKSEIDATIAAAEARAHKEALSKRVQHMPIRAVHLARKMDIVGLFQKLYTDRFKVSHFLHKDSIVLRLSGSHDQTNLVTGMPTPPQTTAGTDQDLTTINLGGNLTSRRAKDKWVVYFDYGAVVFFNCEQQLITTLIKHAHKFSQDVFDMRGHDEELLLVGNPALEKWSSLSENNIIVREIDHINIHVIAGVLAQTVALEHYERQIEAILSEFEKLNTAVERKGPRGALFGIGIGDKQTERQQHKKLFQIVATNNTLLIDLVSKLRVIDRKRPGDAAWSHTRYHTMWESLLEEFELNERFNNLNFKLELIQHNTKFFLEVLGTHKGERMEWYIIILIAAELLISLYELLIKLNEEPHHLHALLPFLAKDKKEKTENAQADSSEPALSS